MTRRNSSWSCLSLAVARTDRQRHRFGSLLCFFLQFAGELAELGFIDTRVREPLCGVIRLPLAELKHPRGPLRTTRTQPRRASGPATMTPSCTLSGGSNFWNCGAPITIAATAKAEGKGTKVHVFSRGLGRQARGRGGGKYGISVRPRSWATRSAAPERLAAADRPMNPDPHDAEVGALAHDRLGCLRRRVEPARARRCPESISDWKNRARWRIAPGSSSLRAVPG